MEKLDAAYEGPAGLARLNQILQMAALTAGEPAQQVTKRRSYSYHYHSPSEGQ